MNLGEKVRRLRQHAGLTQSELAGGEITRNMISRIEAGNASPSLSTLYYLAERLKVSPAYFLSEEDDEFGYQRTSQIHEIRALFSRGLYDACISRCVALDREDAEISLILAQCYMQLGKKALHEGRLSHAQNAFETMLLHAEKTPYDTHAMETEGRLYLRMIAATRKSAIPDFSDIAPDTQSALYLYYVMLNETNPAETHGDTPQFQHVRARQLLKQNRFTEAQALLRRLELADIGAVLRCYVYSDLEKLYTQIGSYDEAFRYRRLLEELQSKMN